MTSLPLARRAIAIAAVGGAMASSAVAMAPVAHATSSPAEVWAGGWSGSDFQTRVGSRTITSSDVGKVIQLRLTADTKTSNVQCATEGIGYTSKLSGKWVSVVQTQPDIQTSGCWIGGVNLVTKITSDMVGSKVGLQGKNSGVGSSTTASVTGQVTIGTEVSATASSSVTKTAAAPAPAPTTPTTPTTSSTFGLSAKPWFGGPSYYAKFPDTARAGWADPNFFPIAVWWGGVNSPAEVQADKDKGINTYVILNPDTDYKLLDATGMSYVGQGLKGQPRTDKSWAADFLEDEADGIKGLVGAQEWMAQANAALPDHNKLRYTNYTGTVYSQFAPWQNQTMPDGTVVNNGVLESKLVNNYSDAVSTDAYWYLSGQCDQEDVQGSASLIPFTKENCRTPQAYGRNQAALMMRDAEDGKLQPTWTFVENVSGGVDDGTVFYTQTPEQIKAAGMSTIINEAAALMWFNQSFGDTPCAAGNAIQAANQPGYACKADIEAMTSLNLLIKSLAPVLNTPTLNLAHPAGTETMFKGYNGSGYLFAMPTDNGTNMGPGTKTFNVPAALKGKPITVVGENRTITPNADGTFSDSFEALTTYHVYKIG